MVRVGLASHRAHLSDSMLEAGMGIENRDFSLNVQGKTVLVTGGASGIGEAIARLFTELGATVCVADLNGSGAAAPEH